MVHCFQFQMPCDCHEVQFSMCGKNTSRYFWLLAGTLALCSNTSTLSDSKLKNQYDNITANFFRFHDFEPRVGKDGRELASVGRSKSFGGRRGRGFQFHADGRSVVVDVEFIVPFIKVPIDRSMNLVSAPFRNLANLNKGALLASGGFIAIAGIVAGILKVLNTPLLYSFQHQKRSGEEKTLIAPIDSAEALHVTAAPEEADDGDTSIFDSMLAKLHAYDLNVTSCIQKAICRQVKQAAVGVTMQKASNMDKILDGLTSLDYLDQYLTGTSLQRAIQAGRSLSSCDSTYQSCKWPEFQNKLIRRVTSYLKQFYYT